MWGDNPKSRSIYGFSNFLSTESVKKKYKMFKSSVWSSKSRTLLRGKRKLIY